MDAWNALWFWPLTERATGGATPPTLDEWLAALEAILGLQGKESKMTGQQTFGAASTWEELNDAERADLGFALVSDIDIAKKQHGWLQVCEKIAADQGFFHWELDFASVFGRGGFDLQVGNPPWVRPRSDEAALLAEGDPWWQLVEKPTQVQIKVKREETLARHRYAGLLCGVSCTNGSSLPNFLGHPPTTPSWPDSSRTYIGRSWSEPGIPRLREASSHCSILNHISRRRKRQYFAQRHTDVCVRHWQFRNAMFLFDEIHHWCFLWSARLRSPTRMVALLDGGLPVSTRYRDTVAGSRWERTGSWI